MRKIWLLIIVFIIVTVVFAQDNVTATPELTAESTIEATPETTPAVDTCPMLVQQALDFTALNCDSTNTDQACYGFIDIDAQTRNNSVSFTSPGDIVNVLDLQGVQLSPMDLNNGLWGLMVMDVTANTSDGSSALGNVQIVLFGDTKLQDASHFVQVTANTDLSIYDKPHVDSEKISSLAAGDSIIVNKKLEDGSWLRVRFNNDSNQSVLGWLQADQVTPSSDMSLVETMTAAEAENPPEDISAQYGPMQAFVFQSGNNDAPCAEAPNSGMLIQTPEGAASVTFVMDEVTVTLKGTGAIRAEAGGNMTVTVQNGEATVESNGVTSTATAGQSIDVQLDNNLQPVSAPSDPRDSTASEVQGLPTSLLNNSNQNTPSAGTWTFVLDTPTPLTCPDGTEVPFITTGSAVTIEPQIDSLIVSGLRFNEVTAGSYTVSYADASGTFTQATLRVMSAISIVGDSTINLASTDCTLNVDYHFVFNG